MTHRDFQKFFFGESNKFKEESKAGRAFSFVFLDHLNGFSTVHPVITYVH